MRRTLLVACLCCLAATAAPAKKPKPPKEPTPLGAAFALTTCAGTSCRPERPAVAGTLTAPPKRRAAAPPEGFLAAWDGRSPKDPHGISARLFKGAAASGADFLASKVVPPDQYDAALAQQKAAGAAFLLVWSETAGGNSDIMARRFAASGAPLGDPFEVSLDATGTSGVPMDFVPAVAATPTGGFVVVWVNLLGLQPLSATNPRVLMRRLDAAGVPLGPPIAVNTALAASDRPGVCVDPSGTIDVVWATVDHVRPFEANHSGVALRRFSAAGAPLGLQSVVAAPISGVNTAPAISCGKAGAFVVSWQSDKPPALAGKDILAQRFGKTGAKEGAVMLVNRLATADHQENPSLSHDAAGNFVVVWQARLIDKLGIFARRFGPTGAELGNVFEVFSRGYGPLAEPSVAHTSANGNFVVVWEDDASIRARRYKP